MDGFSFLRRGRGIIYFRNSLKHCQVRGCNTFRITREEKVRRAVCELLILGANWFICLTEFRHDNGKPHCLGLAVILVLESRGERVLCNEWLQHPWKPAVSLQKIFQQSLQQT